MGYTVTNIVDLIETFATNHKQISTFYFGRLPDSQSEQDIVYPSLLAELLPCPIEEQVERFVFKFYILDLSTHNRTNEKDSLSDTKLIGMDLIAYFRQTVFSNSLSVDTNVTMNPLIGAMDDLCNGWEFDLTFKQKLDLDVCQIPD